MSVVRGLLLILLATLAIPAGAELRTFVDPRTLDETETLRLTLRLEGTRTAAAPDLTPLEDAFEVLGSNSSSQYRSRNGRVQAWVEYQISLRPRRTGTLTIPTLTFGGEQTEPVTVEVRALDPALRAEIDRMVFFETEVSETEVFVQAELVYERRLFYATSGGVQMYSDLPGLPQVPDAVVLPLGDPVSSTTARDGISYGVVAQRYALYPERAGQLTIPGVSLTSSVRVLKNGRARRSGIRVAADPVTVTVLPIPVAYPPDAPWLPARSVNLVQSVTPASGWQTGDTVQRLIRAEVTGNVGSAIPPLLGDADERGLIAAGLQSYPEPASTLDQVLGRSNLGVREERTGLIALRPGELALPPPTLTWWNTRLRRVERTAANPLRVEVTGTAVPDATATPEPAAAAGTDEVEEPQRPALSEPAAPLLSVPLLLLGLSLLAACALAWRRRAMLQARLGRLAGRLESAWLQRQRTPDAATRWLAGQLKAQPPTDWQGALIAAAAQALTLSRQDARNRLLASPDGAQTLTALAALRYGSPDSTATTPPAEQVLAALKAVTGSPRTGAGRAASAPALPGLYPDT
ncbi:MAG: BatD family protein [Pseudomonadota bacterium]